MSTKKSRLSERIGVPCDPPSVELSTFWVSKPTCTQFCPIKICHVVKIFLKKINYF